MPLLTYHAASDQLLIARRRLSEALAIVDGAAQETMLEQHPSHAIALLNEGEQKRLYALLKGDAE